ncbi:hypothetical protein [Sphingomonas sp. 3-13AW]|jgi:hypothetical protein|uniref:hypothetical protein n=1 Tax=Sphingomonas sp. 3-13AW TaxID=3050450 RepID=UPI003BB7F5D0
MRLSNLLVAIAASSLMAAPAMAGSASSLSVVKASTSAKRANALGAGGPPLPIIIVGIAFVVGAVIVLADDNDDKDRPDSN